MKISIRNYTLEFEKNDKKIINQFLKKAVQQTDGSQDVNMVKQNRLFTSILDKLNESDSPKFTKDEYFSLKNLLSLQLTTMKKQISTAGFIKKYLLSSLEKQYSKILTKYFTEK
ncbi:MAG: hypothetical protein IPI12_06560 [Ignavibacteriales bacterium]|jgi:hypothetical protein|nr:hypothetical protein [Ignavibacteriales bacterium]MBP7542954.1 hypothetical protein [Ignavibacteriaceae bacterium]MBK7265987.1 hypothetical protein [Ignavibacteriales bacterium]MBK8663875.1 hypothetical protein [Ignavibacteriales bacterium]MBP9122687.1 hypothetical protein [Ignavibacteriaceae bacterium]